VRLAVSIGGDSDTIAGMAGAVAEAFYGGVPAEVAEEVRRRLAAPLLAVVDRFASAIAPRGDPPGFASAWPGRRPSPDRDGRAR
jgi:hypothetical protein